MDRERSMLMKALTAFILILSAVGVVVFANELRRGKYIGAVPPQNVITVSGTGEVTAVPDIATISFGVTAQGRTVKEAQGKATETNNAAVKYLRGEGVAEKDIKTDYYSAYPRYEWQEDGPVPLGAPSDVSSGATVAYPDYYPRPGNQVLVGYEVQQRISVKVRDTEKAGDILAGLGGTGVTDLSGPNFEIDDPQELQREARQKAIDDARTEAKALAKDLGVRLVRIVSFSEGGNYPMYFKGVAETDAMGGGGVPPSPELPPGENTITSSVTIVYEIR